MKDDANVKASGSGKVGDDDGAIAVSMSKDIKGARSVGLKLASKDGFEVGGETSIAASGKAKTSFSVMFKPEKVPAAVGAYTVAGSESVGAWLKGKVTVGESDLAAKVGVSAYGVPPEYYQDIGGAQGGFFGPMPEYEKQVDWKSLQPERRDWYSRQGFNEKNWSSR